MVVHARYPMWEPRVQREAEALIDAGYEVDVICLRHPGEPARDSVYGVNIFRVPLRRHKDRGIVVQLVEYLAFFCLAAWQLTILHLGRRYDTVQVHNPPDFLVFSTLLLRLTGVKLILDLHDLMPEFYASRFKKEMDSRSVRLVCWQEQIACRFADHIITVTEPWRRMLIQRGLSPQKCSVVMNVADSRKFSGPKSDAQSTRTDRFRLIYHGNIAYRYGLDLILKAVAQLKQDLPNIYLTIHGTGDFLNELQLLAQKLELDEQVYFSTVYIQTVDLPEFIAGADVGVVPYRRDIFTDGILPTKLMEYAALGMPTIVARTPGISAYFDETMVEFFAAEDVQDLARCISFLYHNRSRLDQLAHGIQKFNLYHNWESYRAEYVNLVAGLAQ